MPMKFRRVNLLSYRRLERIAGRSLARNLFPEGYPQWSAMKTHLRIDAQSGKTNLHGMKARIRP